MPRKVKSKKRFSSRSKPRYSRKRVSKQRRRSNLRRNTRRRNTRNSKKGGSYDDATWKRYLQELITDKPEDVRNEYFKLEGKTVSDLESTKFESRYDALVNINTKMGIAYRNFWNKNKFIEGVVANSVGAWEQFVSENKNYKDLTLDEIKSKFRIFLRSSAGKKFRALRLNQKEQEDSVNP